MIFFQLFLRKKFLQPIYLLLQDLLHQLAQLLAATALRTSVYGHDTLKITQVLLILNELKIIHGNLPHCTLADLARRYNLQTRLQLSLQMILIKPHQHCIAIGTANRHPQHLQSPSGINLLHLPENPCHGFRIALLHLLKRFQVCTIFITVRIVFQQIAHSHNPQLLQISCPLLPDSFQNRNGFLFFSHLRTSFFSCWTELPLLCDRMLQTPFLQNTTVPQQAAHSLCISVSQRITILCQCCHNSINLI